MELFKKVKLKETLKNLKGTDIFTLINADDMNNNPDKIHCYFEGTLTAFECTPYCQNLKEKYVTQVFELSNENDKKRKLIIAITETE